MEAQWDGVTQETNVTGQGNLLQNFISQGVDGLVYAATDAQILSDVTQSALDQDLIVTNIDSGTDPQPDEVPVFATDNVAAAEDATEHLIEQLGEEGGEVAFIPLQPGTSTNDTRTEGFENVLEENPQVELIATQSSESDYNTALQVTQGILTANPDLEAIRRQRTRRPRRGGGRHRGEGLEDEITIVGWDTAPDELEAVRDGVVSALVAQNPFRMSYDGTNAAIEEVRSGETPEGGDTGATLVTQDNIDDEEVQAVLDPSCENPPTE